MKAVTDASHSISNTETTKQKLPHNLESGRMEKDGWNIMKNGNP
jgi:hypothetical protein